MDELTETRPWTTWRQSSEPEPLRPHSSCLGPPSLPPRQLVCTTLQLPPLVQRSRPQDAVLLLTPGGLPRAFRQDLGPGACLPDISSGRQRSLRSALTLAARVPSACSIYAFPPLLMATPLLPAVRPCRVLALAVPRPQADHQQPCGLWFKDNSAAWCLQGAQITHFQCRRHRLQPWSGKTPQPRASKPRATATELG